MDFLLKHMIWTNFAPIMLRGLENPLCRCRRLPGVSAILSASSRSLSHEPNVVHDIPQTLNQRPCCL